MAVSIQVVAVITFYMVAALVMVFVNKVVLRTAPNLPTILCAFQSIATVLLLSITSLFTSQVQLPTLDYTTARRLAPLMLIDASGFLFNTLCLRDVEAAYYNIARGLVLPLTILVVSMHSFTRPSLSVVGCACIVTGGFLVGVSFEKGLPSQAVPGPLALFYGFLSSLSIAMHAVLIKSSLPHVNGSATKLSYWSNLGTAVLLSFTALINGEVLSFLQMTQDSNWDWTTFAWGNIVTGVFGFLISIAGILSVKITSPITHMFSSASRTVLQMALGVKIFGDILTTRRIMSASMILLGTLLYTYVKANEPKPQVGEVMAIPKVKDVESQAAPREKI
ncbi:GDP-fucose transporter 1 [Psilocybe cubensis]|uniref:Sugar phosphate transporter domain-containing protein n=2 Tax=Psilocybe cubensis TaxID=181762 RepID=A0A8H7XN00_PSICU|nr:GDP-fucose transporter 1 [Psilocybe cubensis]KAH9475580.1 GDP-fucose transporter 1 [Psilocybe cubensis]